MTQQQVAKRSKMEILKGTLSAPSVQEQFKRALKENADSFIASIIDLYGGDNYLQNCHPNDVAREALKAAVLKLPINKGLGFSYIVPYKGKEGMSPQFQIGYKGYIQLAMRTGQYKVINADVVYEGELKRTEKLSGYIDLSGERTSQKKVGYFAHFEMLNGFAKTLYMTKEEVDAHAKRYSKAYTSTTSAWKTNFDEMAKKTVLRNLLSHYGYLSIEMIGAIEKDVIKEEPADREELNTEDTTYEEVTPEKKPAKKTPAKKQEDKKPEPPPEKEEPAEEEQAPMPEEEDPGF